MTRAGLGLAVAAIVLTTIGCDENLRDLAGPTPDLEPTFSSIQSNILNASDSAGRPACTSCHNPQAFRFNGNLNLSAATAYASLVNAPSSGKPGAIRVVPGDPAASYLIQKIEGAPGIVGARMPMSGPFLTSGQVEIISHWIRLGAPNN